MTERNFSEELREDVQACMRTLCELLLGELEQPRECELEEVE